MTTAQTTTIPPVVVTVDASGIPACNPDTLTVDAAGTIQFTLATTGWKFKTPDAVVITTPGSGADFPNASVTVNDTLATLVDTNVTSKKYKYRVYVINTGTGEEASVDPAIKNTGISEGP